MRAAILHGIRDQRLGTLPDPVPDVGEALVRVRAVGVCGSDVHYFVHGRIGDQVVRGSHVLGHEAAGEVVSVHPSVSSLVPGTRVAIEPGVPCGRCDYCVTGRYNICERVRFLGTPPVPGAYRELMAYPADRLFPLPDTMSFGEGAMVETMVVGLHAQDLSGMRLGDTVAILGCGPVGMVTLKAALAAGASRVIITDRIRERLDRAAAYPRTTTVDITREDATARARALTGGSGPDVVFEAAGSVETVRQAVELVRVGGTVVLIGIPPGDDVIFNSHAARRKELTFRCVRRFRHAHPRCIELVRSGVLRLDDLVSHRYPLERVNEAFEQVEHYRDGVMKALVEF